MYFGAEGPVEAVSSLIEYLQSLGGEGSAVKNFCSVAVMTFCSQPLPRCPLPYRSAAGLLRTPVRVL